MHYFNYRFSSRIRVLTPLLMSMLFFSACAKEATPTSKGTADNSLQLSRKTEKPALPLLSAFEVAQRLEAPDIKTGGEKSPESSIQFASSMAAHSRSGAVVRVVRSQLQHFDSIPESQKPMFILLGAENLSESDVALLEQALVTAVLGRDERAQITALAVLARRPKLAAAADVQRAMVNLLQQPQIPTAIVRHWLAVAIQNISAKVSGAASDELLGLALINSDLELRVLLHDFDTNRTRSILENRKTEIKFERTALIRKYLEGSAL